PSMHPISCWKPRQGFGHYYFLVRPINIRELESQKLAPAQSRECPEMNHGVGMLAEERGHVDEFPHEILSGWNNRALLHGREVKPPRGIAARVGVLCWP